MTGFDTPETFEPECKAERARGEAAAARLGKLISRASSAKLRYERQRDRFGRLLARLTLDGQDVSDIPIGEELARAYAGGQRQSWC